MLSKMWLPLGICGLMLLSTGCVCGTRGACGGFELGPVAYRQSTNAACDTGCCDTGCDSGPPGNFYAGPGPLASFFGLTSCGGGGCGEMYVDEWISEPPTVDQCGNGQCLQCGGGPVRSLLHTILGRQYTGGCETCGCNGAGILENGAIIQDGYQPGTWSSQRSCHCGASGSVGHEFESRHHEQHMESIDPSAVEGNSILINPAAIDPIPTRDNPVEGSGSIKPTPAPALPPSSASRLNPAARRIVR